MRATTLALAKAFFVFSTGMAVAGALPRAVSRASPSSNTDALSGAAVVLVVAATLWLTWLLVRPAFARRCYLRLEADRLVVRHPGLFRKPLEIPRSTVAAVWFDPRPVKLVRGDRHRFHLGDEGTVRERVRDVPEWLYSPEGGAPFPVLSHVADVPNIALAFSNPVEIRRARGARVFPALSPVPLPLSKTRARGLLANVVDPRFAWEVFHGWAPVRPLTNADITLAPPGEHERRRARRSKILAFIGVAALAIVNVLLSVAATGAPRPAP